MMPKWRKPRNTVITSDAYATDAVSAAANVPAIVRSSADASAAELGVDVGGDLCDRLEQLVVAIDVAGRERGVDDQHLNVVVVADQLRRIVALDLGVVQLRAELVGGVALALGRGVVERDVERIRG